MIGPEVLVHYESGHWKGRPEIERGRKKDLFKDGSLGIRGDLNKRGRNRR